MLKSRGGYSFYKGDEQSGLVQKLFSNNVYFSCTAHDFNSSITVIEETDIWSCVWANKDFGMWLFVETLIFGVILVIALRTHSIFKSKEARLERAREAFTRGVAHDMKTPLAIMKNCCECYLEGVNINKNDEYVQTVYDEADKMNESVIAFLNYNRLMTKDYIVREEFDLSEIISSQVEKNMPLAKIRELNVEINIRDGHSYKGDKILIELAAGNYISNAFKYALEGGTVRIELDDEKKFSVYNDCAEISQEKYLEFWNILERGQEDRNRSDKSHGMGLPIVARICELHGIKCWTRSCIGGVIFMMQF